MADLDFNLRLEPFIASKYDRIEAEISVYKDRVHTKGIYLDTLIFIGSQLKDTVTSADKTFFNLALREHLRVHWDKELEIGKKYHCVIIPKTKKVTLKVKK